MKLLTNAKRVIAVLLVIAVVCITGFAPVNTQAATKKVKGIQVKNLQTNQLTLKKGKEFKLKLKVLTTSKNVSKKVSYSSSKKSVATVSNKGVIIAKKKGKTVITIKSKATPRVTKKINVTVGTPVNKISLNNSKTELIVGNTISLKATAYPQNASNKKVIWSTSNSKIATVSKQGKVTAKKAGTVKITATATDGSKKKATCTVQVKNPITVSSLEFIDQIRIKVVLSEPKSLQDSAFVVKEKWIQTGTYNLTRKISNVETKDNKTYIITLKEIMYQGGYYSVSVLGITGTKESQYLPNNSCSSEGYITRKVGTEINLSKTDDFWSSVGNCKLNLTGILPKGIKYTENDETASIDFTGKFEQAGEYNTFITITDEIGNVKTKKITWLIYDEKDILTYVSEGCFIIGDKAKTLSNTMKVVGGSGSYKFEKVSGPSNFSVDSSTGKVSGVVTVAGTYDIVVKVTDASNSSITKNVTVRFNVINGIKISGKVTNKNGNSLAEATIYFESTNENEKYSENVNVETDVNGEYIVWLNPGVYSTIADYADASNYYDSGYQYKAFDVDTAGVNFIVE